MNFLKSETKQRQRDSASCSRDDYGFLHPEQLCDHDILFWREPTSSYYNFRRDGEKHNWAHEGVDLVRQNELAGMTRDVNQKMKDLTKVSEVILRVSV